MFAFPVLLGDIGGTNARFAVLPAPGDNVQLLPRTLTAQTPDPVGAIRIALEAYEGPAPRSAIIAVATRVDAPAIRLTNAHWVIDAEAIGRALTLERVTLVNDYTPVAASVAVLDEARGDLAPYRDLPAAEARPVCRARSRNGPRRRRARAGRGSPRHPRDGSGPHGIRPDER